MALQSDHERLLSAWRALAGNYEGHGWRTIPIEPDGSYHLLAGRHFPGNEEAILVGFNSVWMPSDSHLLQGRGFRVENVRHEISDHKQVWIALSRKSAGRPDVFTRMAEDIVGMLRAYDDGNDKMLFQLFLGRIRAWQEFMQRSRDDVLDPEAEVGLFGELLMMKMILEFRIPAVMVLESWNGPLDGLQDFLIGTGAIEVKSTVAVNGFPATIDSLEQLDGRLVSPLFLAGIRLFLDNSGNTLPEIIAELDGFLGDNHEAKGKFENLILRAGFLRAFSDSYKRRFTHNGTRIMPVNMSFPALTRGKVDIAIRKARYEIDLDLVSVTDIALDRALEELGVAW